MLTYEKFSKNVGVRCIRRGYVSRKLRARYHTLVYVGIHYHTSNLSENFEHAHNFQCMRIAYTLDIRYSYATCTLCIRSRTLHVRYLHVYIRLYTSQPVASLGSVCVAYV